MILADRFATTIKVLPICKKQTLIGIWSKILAYRFVTIWSRILASRVATTSKYFTKI